MLTKHTPQAKLTTVACFPDHSFLENLAVRVDSSILVSVLNRKELWCVPSPTADLPAEPVLMHTFAQSPMCIGGRARYILCRHIGYLCVPRIIPKSH